VAKQKVSVTLSPDRVARAREVVGTSNLSDLLDEALLALVERELERRWLAARAEPDAELDLPGEVAVDLGELPWS
jgi:post-segregation antitoxin (ccd killing protein)